ncbi:cytidine/deoxycytidylate deaminase family protein [Burkholderia alba]|uniref:hypothetical protein n=1 Tax=Burkholderia alba TaxID=2683677 RepID=UPI002B053D61|nr:hypothetical protein [Burkholderia alba]
MLTYDNHLENALKYLFDHWFDDRVGLVAAALIDDSKSSYATSMLNSNGTWKHAERNALEQFEVTHGKPTTHAVMLSTLSPCIRAAGSGTTYGDQKNAARRQDESCSALIKRHGITTIGFGILDHEEANENSYSNIGFKLINIRARTVIAVCKALNDMFPAYIAAEERGEFGCVTLKRQLLGSSLCPKTMFERMGKTFTSRNS